MATVYGNLPAIVITELFGQLLWPVRQLWLACYCHGVILATSCLFHDHECEMLYGQFARYVICLLFMCGMKFACFYGATAEYCLELIINLCNSFVFKLCYTTLAQWTFIWSASETWGLFANAVGNACETERKTFFVVFIMSTYRVCFGLLLSISVAA